jgi:hypothetical protein
MTTPHLSPTLHQPFTFAFYRLPIVYTLFSVLLLLLLLIKRKKVKGGDRLKGCFPFSYQKMKKKMKSGENVIFSPKNPKNTFFFTFIADLKTTSHPPPPHPKN